MGKLTPLQEKALKYAWHWHGSQARKYTGEPYVYHLMNVADIVREVMPEADEVIAAALLHDAVEDTEATLLDIAGHFGKEVAGFVEWVTDVSRPSDGNRKRRKEIDRLHLAKAPDEAQTIKLADILDNTKDIVANDPSFARVYLREKRELVEVLTRGHPALLEREAHYLTDDGDYERVVYAEDPAAVKEHLAEIAAIEERDTRFDLSSHRRLRPAIHMPRWASRITLEVTGVKVERLQDISEDDAKAEGAAPVHMQPGGPEGDPGAGWISYVEGFRNIWTDINGPGSWDANPWVVAISFRTLSKATGGSDGR